MQGTVDDPGAGDLESLRDAQRWFLETSKASEEAQQQLLKITKSLPSVWTGKSASAFGTAIQNRLRSLTESKEVTDAVVDGFKKYIDIVEEIKEQAKHLIEDRAAAQLAMSREYLDSTTSPPDDAELARRECAFTAAQASFETAVSKLATLAERRAEADAAFAKQALGASSQTWGYLSALPARTGFKNPKYDANAQSWELFSQFASGKGPRSRFFTDGDSFTEHFRNSPHIKDLRQNLREKLRDGTLPGSDDEDRRISDHPEVLLGDVITYSNGGEWGNFPEAMLGSYVLSYTVNSIDAQGNAEVTFTATNPMTRDSFTRIPLTGGAHLPWYESLNEANEQYGTWDNTQQTIVWTEILRMPQ